LAWLPRVASDPRVNEPHPPTVITVWLPLPVVTQDQKVLFNTTAWPRPESPAPALVHVDRSGSMKPTGNGFFRRAKRLVQLWKLGESRWCRNGESREFRPFNSARPSRTGRRRRCWNFPMGRIGRLRVKLLLSPGFAGARWSHRSFFGSFRRGRPKSTICTSGNRLKWRARSPKKSWEPGRWHDWDFDWDDTSANAGHGGMVAPLRPCPSQERLLRG